MLTNQEPHGRRDAAAGSMPGRIARRVALAVTIAVSVVVLGGWGNRSGAGREVTVLRGTVTAVNASATAVAFEGRRVAGPRLRIADVDGSWIVAGASWSDAGTWHDSGTPTCLERGAGPTAVELGVVEAARRRDAPARGVVAWLRCPAPPPTG
jgi:hypothetical protein